MILPMIGQMGSFARPSADLGDVQELYLHGYVSSRIMNLSRKDVKGLPVCVAASHVDGLVLAMTPFAHSYNYRSAVLFGHATVVADADEVLYGMELITDSVVPDRWRNSRVPPNGAEMQSTTVLKVVIASGSAKVRAGEPHDEKRDIQDESVASRVWSGVLPVHQTIGAPIPGPHNKVDEPAYIAQFVKDFNEAAREQALSAAIEPEEEKSKD